MSNYVCVDGTTLKKATATIARVRAINLPSETRNKIDVTGIDNANVKTYVMSKLADSGDITLTLGVKDAQALVAGNAEYTIELSDGSEVVFWADLMSRVPSQLTAQNEVLVDVTLGITNLNATEVETPPVWTMAEAGA